MKYKLNVSERLGAVGLLPTEGDIFTIRIKTDLGTKLLLGAKEQKIAKLKPQVNALGKPTGLMQWDSKYIKAIDLEEKEVMMIRSALVKRNDEKTLNADLLSLYEKFVEGKPN